MIDIAICDDEENTRAYLSSLIRKQNIACEVTEYASAQDLLADAEKFGLLFLDIELGGGSLNGMALARQLRARQGAVQPVIIFVTGYESYVFDAFDVDAFQYLLKPVDEDKFREVFRRAVKRLQADGERRTLVVQQSHTSRAVPIDTIRYVESSNHKVILHLQDTRLAYYARISALEQQLGDMFFRIHKGYLVNLACVDAYTRAEVTLCSGEKLIISKYKYGDFVKAYHRYLKRGLADE